MRAFHRILFFLLYRFGGKGGVFDILIIFCARWLPFIFIPAILVLNALFGSIRFGLKEFLSIIFVAAVAALVAELIKYLFPTPRPFIALPNVHPLVPIGGLPGAFPSAHASFFTALGFAYYLHNPWVGVTFVCAAFVIGIARVMAGVHWPLDIIGGIIFGIIIALGAGIIL